MNNKNKKVLLDCTLRDGGYYNNWHFDKKIVQNYLSTIKKSGIQVVEIGFRFLKKEKFLGEFAYSNEKFINSLNLPSEIKYAVMINAKEFIGNEDLLKKFFIKSNLSRIKIVRIAVNIGDYFLCKKICSYLKKNGYIVGLNLMQSHDLEKREYKKISQNINKWGLVDVLYFADSLGCMNNQEIKLISRTLVDNFKGSVGIHAHNNKGLALSNTLVAIKEGINWFDSTITGMGRGAGNTETEHLSIECNLKKILKLNSSELIPCVSEFNEIKKKYNWGSNIFYHLGAISKIHPTYIQNILSDKRYKKDEVVSAIKTMQKLQPSSYRYEIEEKIFYQSNKKIIKGSFDALNCYKNKEVILIGSGESLRDKKDIVINFINKNKDKLVFYLNDNKYLNNYKAEGIFVCNNSRFAIDYHNYKTLGTKFIIPKKLYGKLLKNKKLNVLDYAFNIGEKSFVIEDNFCITKWPLAIAYALSFLTIGNVKKINLLGFDGYRDDKKKNNEMNDIFEEYNKFIDRKEIISITKTKYKIPKKVIL
jgi:4-hydroxy 2-oxovalerate aldolase